nr:hypothetical protein CFP56_71813 [Quercus suber]
MSYSLLEKSDCAAVRNNLVVMMADFCVQYTALADWENNENSRPKRMHIYVSLLKQMATDPEHLWVTFAKLCAEILAAVSDGMLDIEDITGQSVLQVNLCFVGKAPLLAYNIFVEAIFIVNNCRAHNGHIDSQASRVEGRLFFHEVDPEHLWVTFAKLCAEILAAVSDGMLDIEDITGQSVLQETKYAATEIQPWTYITEKAIDITLSPPVRTDYAENLEIVL